MASSSDTASSSVVARKSTATSSDQLPSEVLGKIITCLRVGELSSVALVAKKWYEVVDEGSILLDSHHNENQCSTTSSIWATRLKDFGCLDLQRLNNLIESSSSTSAVLFCGSEGEAAGGAVTAVDSNFSRKDHIQFLQHFVSDPTELCTPRSWSEGEWSSKAKLINTSYLMEVGEAGTAATIISPECMVGLSDSSCDEAEEQMTSFRPPIYDDQWSCNKTLLSLSFPPRYACSFSASKYPDSGDTDTAFTTTNKSGAEKKLMLTTAASEFCRDCAELKHLDVSGLTGLTTVEKSFAADCQKLKCVNFSGLTRLKEIGKYFLLQCIGLTRVSLIDCINLETIGHSCMSSCSSLEELVLGGNHHKLKTIESSFLRYCPRLQRLNLEGLSGLERIGKDFCRGCISLVSLDFSNCRSLRTIHDNFLCGCEKITSLNMSGLDSLQSLYTAQFLEGNVVFDWTKFKSDHAESQVLKALRYS